MAVKNHAGIEGMMTPARVTAAFFGVMSVLVVADARPALCQERTPGAARTAAAAAACQPGDFRVVLDVGHTAAVPGALSAHGIPEYVFNMRLAADIKDALDKAGFAKTVLLVTDKAPPLGLFERTWSANKLSADLFIAIHHDSVPDDLLQTWQFADHEEHFNDSYPGYAIFISNENADRAGSLAFGHLLGKALQARGLAYTPHYTLPLMRHRRRQLVDAEAGVYRYDALVVLQRTHMPAVLLEAGSIINRTEDLEMATPERRASIGAAVAAAVTEFCASRPAARHHNFIKRASAPDALTHRRSGGR